jgi:AraC-like DNA-binding protein
MSRSAFAARFKELLGQTPLEYVREWRMQKAVQLLKQKETGGNRRSRSVMNLMLPLARRSKRVVGFTPGEYRHNGGSC